MRTTAFEGTGLRILRDLIRARTGLNFPESRQQDLDAGIHRTMTNSGSADLDQFAGLLDTDQCVFDTLIANITVAETYFFREPSQFEVLRQQVLPDLRRHLVADSRLRVWSAGCASGEEPYSLAILLEQEGLAEHASILATDISRHALTRAREARYNSWSLRGGAGRKVAQYFDRHGDRFVLQDRYRQRVEFRYLNLASDAYPSPITGTLDIDLILCRNVLIYFDQERIRQVARQLFESLRVGGWLITGPSDPPLWDYAPYQTLVTAAGVFYRREEGAGNQIPVVVPRATARLGDESQNTAVMPPPVVQIPEIDPAVGAVEASTFVKIDHVPQSASDTLPDCGAYVSRVRVLADRGDSRQAEAEAVIALGVYPLSTELHYLHAIVFTELRRHGEAVASLRRVIYLDPSLAMAHFTLGSVLAGLGAVAEAQRAYRNALALCLERPKDEILPLSDNEFTKNLIEATRTQLARIGEATETPR